MKNNQYLIVIGALIVIYFLHQHLTKESNVFSNINKKTNRSKTYDNISIPQTTSITQQLSDGLKSIPNIFSKVNDKPMQIIRNKAEYTEPIFSNKDYVKQDIISSNPIGSTEFSFIKSDPNVAWSDDNVSQHPSYHRAKFNDNLTDVGSFFKNNEFHDKTSPHSENHLPDRCFLNQGEILCEFNDKIQNIPPKLIMNEEYNEVLNSIGKLKQKGEIINKDEERPNNGGEFFKDVYASSSKNETNLSLENLPKNINYSF